MKAVYFEKNGGPEVLVYGDVPDPIISYPDELIIRVEACALNHLDIWMRQGLPNVQIPMPHISGADVCGVVESVGSNVSLALGTRVLVCPGQLDQGEPEAMEARDSYSPKFTILGLQSQGGYAQLVRVHKSFVVPVDDTYTSVQWAALPLAAMTAYHMLITRANLKKNEQVLVHAAGSGVGACAIQIAKSLGARVLTTVGSEEKKQKALALGADEVVLYKDEDFAQAVKRWTQDRGVDVIFEHIGPETWPKNLQCLARGGRMVTCGATSGPKAEVDIRFLFSKQLSILGSYMGSFQEFLAVVELAKKGTLKPVVDSVFDLSEARQAQQRMLERKNFGKIILNVPR